MGLNYKQILTGIKRVGDEIHQYSGKSRDRGITKQSATQHDINTERKLCKFIKLIDNKAIFFTEEEHKKIVKEADSLWIIDPISNTFNFIHGLPHYSICVSHMLKGEIVFGAVYDPSMKELFHAIKSEGSYLNNERIYVSENTTDLAIIIGPHITPANMKRTGETIELIKIFSNVGTIRSIGSLGIQYAYIACGRAEIAISLPKDIFPEMAGKLLVEEAGGKFTDFKGDKISISSKGIIASNNLIYNTVLEKINNSFS